MRVQRDVLVHAAAPRSRGGLTPGELANIFTIYGVGCASVFVLFAMLYQHAWRRRVALRLDPAEAYEARLEMGGQLVSAAIGLLAAAWAIFAPRQYAVVSISGFVCRLMGLADAAYGAWLCRRRRAFARAVHASTEA